MRNRPRIQARETIRILLTGSGGFAAIGFARCLKKSGARYYIVGADSNPDNIFFSQADRTYLIPPASSSKYIGAINRIVRKERISLIWSQPQPEVEKISEHRERVAAQVFMPKKETIRICSNKIETAKHLKTGNIPIAKSVLLTKPTDLKRAFRILGRTIWLRAIRGAGGKGAFLAKNYKEGLFWIEFNKGWGEFSASEYLPGKGYGCDMLFYEGKLVFSQVKERLSYFMSKANIVGVTGTTGILKTVDNKSLNKLCERAVYAIDQRPHGAFDVDIKCGSNGNPKVTEINAGRFLSSSVSLFYKTGFLAPHYAVNLAMRGKLPRKIQKINPIRKDIIISRQLDIEPVMYTVKKRAKIVRSRTS